jgi:hypothetical protein
LGRHRPIAACPIHQSRNLSTPCCSVPAPSEEAGPATRLLQARGLIAGMFRHCDDPRKADGSC